MSKITYIILVFILVGLNSCNLFYDIDTTNVSVVSTKPVIQVLGDEIQSIKVGGTYQEEGCIVSVTADSTDYPYEYIGAPDVNTAGFYIVTYTAVNGFGWKSRAFRSILVHEGNSGYSDDIAGNYESGIIEDLKKRSSISKYDVDGFWYISDGYGQLGTKLPIIFADKGDGINYGIVPNDIPDFGLVTGTAVRNSLMNSFTFSLRIEMLDGSVLNQSFIWKLKLN
ncbi:MAG: hypothetical protein JXL97_08835 [Bacteroidales bacterium]|nr:hypothetical protein [Bacteroidales bacterium]